MAYIVALFGVTIGVISSIAFVFAYRRQIEGLSGPWILSEGRRND